MSNAIKEYLVGQFSGSITVGDIILSLIVAFAISIFIVYVYRKTYTGVVFNKNITLTMIMLAVVTSMIIRTINSNLSLSLGMVGALSIVRFRTAIKEPLDTAFMFWAITAGIMSGAGQYLIAILGSLILGLLFYGVYMYDVKAKNQYLLVVSYGLYCEEKVLEKLNELKQKKLKNKTISTTNKVEATYEVVLEDEKFANELKEVTGVNSVNLVSYKNDLGI